MKNINNSSSFYNQAIHLIDLDDCKSAIKYIKKNIYTIADPDDIALAYLNCAFLNDKLGDYTSAIEDFSKSISFDDQIEITSIRSKDISFNGRSNSRYKNGHYQGAIEDKRKAKEIRLFEIEKFSEKNNIKIDFKSILLGTFIEIELEPKYYTLIKVSKIERSRYDLITDYRKVISNKSKEEVIRKLESLSEEKYRIGDYKGSIKAIRRAERFY